MRVVPRRVLVVSMFVATVLGGAGAAAAEPIQLVSGAIAYSRGNLAEFAATADDNTIVRGEFGNFTTETWNPDHACFGCIPGSTIDLSQSESLAFGSEAMGVGGSVRVGGLDYWIDSLVFSIASASLTVPDSSNDARNVMSPFSFDGVITARSLAGETRTFSLSGIGLATARFTANDWVGTTYQFAAATPEPGTLLLLGGPALALLRRLRARNTGV